MTNINTRELRLSQHFTLYETLHSSKATELGIQNMPATGTMAAIVHAAQGMERVRAALDSKPVIVNSWYRNPAVNAAVGGVTNSDHLSGYAVDFRCPAFGGVTAVCRAIEAAGIDYDQLIWEYGRWVHISFAPAMRGQTLHIDTGTGYRLGLPDA